MAFRKDELGGLVGGDSLGAGTPPGDSLFHCHILEHQDTGMMGVWRIR
jgi:hypothetical protein